ncbi:MAG: Tex family protein [Candidatus Cryptobacteroides sp.]|nr:Tex family protein [Bacteroidales bacterium]MDY5459955.1 Tex family protein [Candidatus Cryptobacteroides sp.]
MKPLYIKAIADRLSLNKWQIENCVLLLEDGNTIPFISRYRKEQTGGMDDSQVAEVKHWADTFDDMEKRKSTIIQTIEKAGKLTEQLKRRIENSVDSTELEDLYLPFKPKRRTRATVAKELGLEGLADIIWELKTTDPKSSARPFVNEKVPSTDEALSGARDIIAERLSEEVSIREKLRSTYRRSPLTVQVARGAKGKPELEKYRSYIDFSRPLDKVSPHNLLAILRAENEGLFSIGLTPREGTQDDVYYQFCRDHGRPQSAALSKEIKLAAEDSYQRLLDPSISNEIIKEAKQKADIESIRVFGDNLRQLLLESPVGEKRTLAIDPGFRNGCKLAVLDEHGALLAHEIIFPHPPQNERIKSLQRLEALIDDFNIEAIAVGNGTASRETMDFLNKIDLPQNCKVWSVSEDGASIYSASEVARKEMPDEDVTVRGAVSIGRRLMDPLAELVKIDPKNLGIGQYQHDVDQTLLREKLDNTIEACVNSVGVNLNTASPYLLAYVAGIGKTLAESIVDYRSENGAFKSRESLKKVPKLGEKTFRQCAGFLRIRGAENPLDGSAVHPESYHIVDKMARDLGVEVKELVGNDSLCKRISPDRYVTPEKGLPTINDIIKELAKPGLDPRSEASSFSFAEDIRDISDLKTGMELPGIVTNITNFGAFVDLGIHENGLIHISKMKGKSLALHQKVKVRVESVELDRKRIGLGLVS